MLDRIELKRGQGVNIFMIYGAKLVLIRAEIVPPIQIYLHVIPEPLWNKND